MIFMEKTFRIFTALILFSNISCSGEIPANKRPSPVASQGDYYAAPVPLKDNPGKQSGPKVTPSPVKSAEVKEPVRDLYKEVEDAAASARPTFYPLNKIPLSPLAQKVFDRITSEIFSKTLNSTISRDNFLSGNNKLIKVMVDGPDIFTGFKEQIARAENEVSLLCYGWDTGSDAEKEIGKGLKLAEQNIKSGKKLLVRIIVDDLKLDFEKEIRDLENSKKSWNLDESKINIQLSVYPHVGFASLHSKYLVVDGKSVIITGANVEEVYDFNENGWHDTAYLFEGPLVKTVLEDFDEAWDKHAKHMECKPRILQKDCQEVTYLDHPPRDYLNNISYNGGLPVIALAKTGKNITNNDVDNPQDQAWLSVMENAENYINIESPNINDDAFLRAVIETVKRGVTVKIITGKGNNDTAESIPGQGGTNVEIIKKLQETILKEIPEKKDKLQLRWYSRDGQGAVIGRGAKSSHTKFMSVDNKIAIVGSGNQDTQSWNQSREFNVLIDDAAATLTIENSFFNPDWDKAEIIPW
jgi:phosphatidylserine/phosphatidylglycerophosphate/cardiolipin synthase-like enzyme